MLKQRKYFLYKDVLSKIQVDYSISTPYYIHSSMATLSTWFKSILTEFGLEYNSDTISSTIPSATIEAIVKQLMNNVLDRHLYDYIYYKDGDYNDDIQLGQEDYRNIFGKLLNVLDLTLPKYLPLFIQNKEYSANPVAPIKSESKGRTRFNDTPQTYFVSETELNDESHASNVSESSSESSVDTGSIVERLDEAFKNWRSIILEWSNEFNQCFLKEEQIVW